MMSSVSKSNSPDLLRQYQGQRRKGEGREKENSLQLNTKAIPVPRASALKAITVGADHVPIIAVNAQFRRIVAFAVSCGECAGEGAAVFEHGYCEVFIPFSSET